MGRRKFVKNTLVVTGGTLFPWFLSRPSSTGLEGLKIYTSIPKGFPILSHLFQKTFGVISSENSFMVYNENGERFVAHPDKILTEPFISKNDDVSFVSTIGEFLTAADKRLALIENVPIIGKNGVGVYRWLYHQDGERYWQSCASDWGYHVLPTMLVNSTDLGWIRNDVNNLHYSQFKVRARGVVKEFFDHVGSQNLQRLNMTKTLKSPAQTKQLSFLQMLSHPLDQRWEKRLDPSFELQGGRNRGALLLGLYLPRKVWDSFSHDEKQRLQLKTKTCLQQSLQQTSQFTASSTDNYKGVSLVQKDFRFFAKQLVSETLRSRDGKELARLFV